MLYEKLAASYGQVSSQMLLAPVPVNLSAEEKHALAEHAQLLEAAGVQAEDFGGSTVLVRAVPADVEAGDVEDLVCELAAKLAGGSKDAMSEKTEWVLHSIACKAAIKAGDRSDRMELLRLAQDILDGRLPRSAPRPAGGAEADAKGAGKAVWPNGINRAWRCWAAPPPAGRPAWRWRLSGG